MFSNISYLSAINMSILCIDRVFKILCVLMVVHTACHCPTIDRSAASINQQPSNSINNIANTIAVSDTESNYQMNNGHNEQEEVFVRNVYYQADSALISDRVAVPPTCVSSSNNTFTSKDTNKKTFNLSSLENNPGRHGQARNTSMMYNHLKMSWSQDQKFTDHTIRDFTISDRTIENRDLDVQCNVCTDYAKTQYLPQELPNGCSQGEKLQSPKEASSSIICSGSDITSIKPFPSNLRHLYSVTFYDTRITRFEDTACCNLPHRVTRLAIRNSLLTSFNATNIHCVEGLQILELTNNMLRGWSFAWFSRNVNTSIKVIDLRDNSICFPPVPDTYPDDSTTLPELMTIIFSNNPITHLPESLFYPIKNSPIKHLLLDSCKLRLFSGSPLQNMTKLEWLDLSDNIDFGDDRLDSFLRPMSGRNLTKLHINFNFYRTPPKSGIAHVASSLVELSMYGTLIGCLDKTSFPVMNNLKNLFLNDSLLYTIKNGTFSGMPQLQYLCLSDNKLKTIPAAVQIPSLLSLVFDNQELDSTFLISGMDFKNMENLTDLSLNRLRISSIEEKTFEGLTNLHVLHIDKVGLRSIEKGSFKNLPHLSHLHLMGNQLEYLVENTFEGLKELKHLNLENNKIMFKDTSQPLRLKENLGNTQSLLGWLLNAPFKIWSDTTETVEQFNSSLHTQVSPFKDLVNLTHLDLAGNEIESLFPELFLDMPSLIILNLNNNYIESWDQDIFQENHNINKIFLHHNDISTVSDEIVRDLQEIEYVDLRRNNLRCTCLLANLTNMYDFENMECYNLSNFQTYTTSTEAIIISEYLNITGSNCEDSNDNVENDKIKDNYTDIIIVSVVSLGLLFAVSLLAIYKNRWYMKYQVYRLRMRTTQDKVDTTSSEYLYDTFVCYSNSDRHWIFEQLLDKLESQGKYRVCVHERDFTAGREIAENIVNSVDRSRKVVVVLSPAFVSSSWCMFELQIANSKTLVKYDKLIFVVLHPLQDSLIPKTLRVLLKTRTYIPWHPEEDRQHLFWAKIEKAIVKQTDTNEFNL